MIRRLNHLLTPDLIVRHVTEIPVTLLVEKGIKAVVTDLDNTLVLGHSEDVKEDVTGWLTALRDAGIGVCIASNTRNYSRLKRLAVALDIHCVPENAKKPGTAGIHRALSLLKAYPHEAAMIGDQLFTDMVAGKRLGLFTALVNPLGTREFIGTRIISRPAERLILRGNRKRPD